MKTIAVQLGARIPEPLKKKLARFCREHGLKMSYVITAALEDKLGEFEEEIQDRELGRARLKDAEFFAVGDLDRYMARRRAKR